MRNRFLSDIRRRRETTSVDDVSEANLSLAPSQEDNLAVGELRRHLARLQPDHRLALMMITVQGMSYEEVSAELGVAIGTLKCRVFRARKQLKNWLLGDEAAPRAAALPEKSLGKQGEVRAGTRRERRVDRSDMRTDLRIS
jgi:RNA polymerase sigma-70 factor (ECF subfamily)